MRTGSLLIQDKDPRLGPCIGRLFMVKIKAAFSVVRTWFLVTSLLRLFVVEEDEKRGELH